MFLTMRWAIGLLVLAVTTSAEAKGKSDCALMQQLAQAHSNDMAHRESMDHDNFSDRAERGARAENVAMGSKTKDGTMAQWRASPGHAANMLLPGCKAVAYAVSKSGRYYWTMEIGKSPDELNEKTARQFRDDFTTSGSAATPVSDAAKRVWSSIAGGMGKLRKLFQ
jgi:hypothetical protein